MTITIVHGALSMHPQLMLDGYEWKRALGNVVHSVPNTGKPAITFRAATPRSGTLRFWFTSAADAAQCEAAHATAGTFALTDTKVPAAAMTYVPYGESSLRLDPPTGRWVHTINFQEVIV